MERFIRPKRNQRTHDKLRAAITKLGLGKKHPALVHLSDVNYVERYLRYGYGDPIIDAVVSAPIGWIELTRQYRQSNYDDPDVQRWPMDCWRCDYCTRSDCPMYTSYHHYYRKDNKYHPHRFLRFVERKIVQKTPSTLIPFNVIGPVVERDYLSKNNPNMTQ